MCYEKSQIRLLNVNAECGDSPESPPPDSEATDSRPLLLRLCLLLP